MVTRGNHGKSRSSALLQAKLRERLRSGEVTPGELLPSVRTLSSEHGLAPKTVHRALKALAAEGLAVAEPRHGFRVLARANDPHNGCPVAYVLAGFGTTDAGADRFHRNLQNSLQRAMAERSWSLLGVSLGDRRPEEVMRQLVTARTWAVILDVVNPEFLELVEKARMPAVMVDAWVENAPFDAVLQNNYQGGFLAANHLVK